MLLFDLDLPRLDTEPAKYAEAKFPYLNRSGRCDAFRVRNLLEAWFASFPPEAREDLRRRFRSPDELIHYGAFFELYVHALLTRLGCQVEAIIPDRDSRRRVRTPDFRARGPDGNLFLVEATVATDKSKAEAAAERVQGQLYDTLDRIHSPNFFIGVEVFGKVRRAPSHRVLCPKVEAFLRPLDPDLVPATMAGGDLRDLPRHRIDVDGGRIEIYAIPKSPSARGQDGVRPLGITGPGPVRWVDQSVALRRAVTSKATRYGRLIHPYVIVVDAISQHLRQTDIMEALFGKETFMIPLVDGRSGEPAMTRQPNGAWLGPTGPTNTRVSAVVVASSIVPWSVGAYTPIVYHNPFAQLPLDGGAIPRLPAGWANGNRMVEGEGATAREIFDLPAGWPDITDASA